MKRRDFSKYAGAIAISWPLAAWAQQRNLPTIGFVHLNSLSATQQYLAAFHQGLREEGFAEGRNVAIEYRWADGDNTRLHGLIEDLVRRKVGVLVVLESTNGALAAKAATASIPVVFMQGADPVRIGLVKSLSQPGVNLTGINLMLAEVAAKRFELLTELIPGAKVVAYLRNPTNPVFAEAEANEVQNGARAHDISLILMDGSRLSALETAFANLAQQPISALFVSSDGFLLNHSDRVAALAADLGIPAIYGWREAVTRGGLLSYGTYFPDAWRQAGVYTGRVLKGEKPANLPVQQVTKIELCINLSTARRLGLTVPPDLLGRADAVIE